MNNVSPAIAPPYLVWVSLSCFAAAFLWMMFRIAQKLRPRRVQVSANAGMRLKEDFDRSPSFFDRSLTRLVEQSGISMRSQAYTILSLGCSSVAGMLALILTDDVVLGFLSALATLGVMGIVILVMRSRRRSQVLAQLPTAIDMIARGLQAGDGLEKSLQTTSQRLQGPLKQDFGWCASQLQMGLPLKKALRQLDDRSELFELRMFNSALIIHRDTGGDLARMLERLARVLHARYEYRRQIATATATARLAAIIIGLAGPGLLAYYAFQKDYFGELWQDPSVQFYILLALGREVVGIVWLFALTKSEL